ncbi:5-oxoprolinase subunit PxpB [Bacillus sp. FJAT-49736]|uniref:5-oxoprolinase subunit PxpB n=1 Tax=Bacillus sp. FJAT-49736 TaxID=2833582 RepID=UPI001BC9F039|nr:5-oxoprolinase subunit PxpB [Bacillus sp. FJAT-49736]MBS4174339.1 5-oxoprolinase subunit PxpB [Bacillus sp. FJAT-49736]
MFPLGDSAIMIEFGSEISKSVNEKVLQAADYFIRNPFRGMVEVVPAYTTLTIHYNPIEIQYEKVCHTIKTGLSNLKIIPIKKGKKIRIPVCYEQEFALDIDLVAEENQLTSNEVISIHTKKIYDVYFLGFAPGFPFLGGMDPRIAAPRKQSPRLKIPAGSVGIAGGQTGVYPLATPGGWQIIGRTPVELFSLEKTPPTLLEPGDKVQFVSITKQEYNRIERGEHKWAFEF